MNKKHSLSWSFTALVALFATIVMGSCAVDGYDDETFSSGVTGQTLSSPIADSITFVANADGSKTTITWPVVYGASGYRCSLSDVTDPSNPVVVVSDTTIDGTSIVVPRAEDTNYAFYIQTLGNTDLNNSDATDTTVAQFTSFVESYSTIPDGSDLAAWLASLDSLPEDQGEIILDLEAGGHYTLDSDAVFGNAPVTIRTASTDRATITVAADANFVVKGGFKLKNLIIDGSATDDPLILLNSEPNPATLNIKTTARGYYYIEDPITITNCEIDGLTGEFINNNDVQYVVETFLIDNSIIHFNTATGHSSNTYFDFYDSNAGIRDFTIRNSTVYNSSENTMNYMIRYSNSFRPSRVEYDDMSVNLEYTTLYNIVPNKQIANYGSVRAAGSTCTITLDHNIIVNCSKNQFVRRICGGDSWSGSVVKDFDSNTYVFDGADAWTQPDPSDESTWTGEIVYDQSGTIISGDPGFADAANGDFTVSSANQIAAQSGDPRWQN